jgi:predicted Zn-dependent protease
VSPSVRVRLVVGLLAVTAAAVVVGVVSATRQDPRQPQAQCRQRPAAYLVPGVPTRHGAAVRAALARPPRAAAQALEPLAQAAPEDAAVQFNYGIALFCAGYGRDAEQAFLAAKKAGRDSFYEIRADSILHPQYFQDGYPPFILAGATADPLLVQGALAQRQGHQHTAERLFARAARLHPNDDQAQVAAAVARFDESNLSASFSRLGPLVERFPRSVSVRYHLALLLVWTGQRDQAIVELRAASRLGPRTRLGSEAGKLLQRLVTNGTSRTKR